MDMEEAKKIAKLKEQEKEMMKRYGYVIHCIVGFDPKNSHYGNFHTHGLKEKHGHNELEFSLNISRPVVVQILHNVVRLIENGRKLQDGDLLEDVIGDYPVKVKLIEGEKGPLCRIMVPDPIGRFPGDKGCEEPYASQERIPSTSIEEENPILS